MALSVYNVCTLRRPIKRSRRERLLGLLAGLVMLPVSLVEPWVLRYWVPLGPVKLRKIPKGSLKTETDEDALTVCQRWVSAFTDKQRPFRVDQKSTFNINAQFKILVRTREGGHDRMMKMLWDRIEDLDKTIDSGHLPQTEKLRLDLYNLYYIALVAYNYANKVRENYARMILQLVNIHEKLTRVSDTGNIIAFQIMQDLVFEPCCKPRNNPCILLCNRNVQAKIIQLMLETFVNAWSTNPLFFQSQNLHQTFVRLICVPEHEYLWLDRDAGPASIRRAFEFLHDVSIVDTRAQVIVLLFQRKVPLEIAKLIAEADIGSVHSRLLTKGLKHIYSVTPKNPIDDRFGYCVPQDWISNEQRDYSQHLRMHRSHFDCDSKVRWSPYLRGWAHKHSVPLRCEGLPRMQWCRYPLDECAGQYEQDDLSWRLDGEELELLKIDMQCHEYWYHSGLRTIECHFNRR